MTRLKEGIGSATETARRKAAETKQTINRRLNQDLFEGIIAGCVLIMNTSRESKSAADRASEEHKLLINLAERGITNYFSQEEITQSLAKYMSVFESGNFLAGYGLCVAAVAQVRKEADMTQLIRFMYDISAADGNADPNECQTIVDVAGFIGFKGYAAVEPALSGYAPFRMDAAARNIETPKPPPGPASPPSPPEGRSKDQSADDGMPDWMRK